MSRDEVETFNALKKLDTFLDSQRPGSKVTRIMDWSEDEVLIEAPVGERDTSDPYYIYKMSDGTIRPFLPVLDYDGFEKALNNVIFERGKI